MNLADYLASLPDAAIDDADTLDFIKSGALRKTTKAQLLAGLATLAALNAALSGKQDALIAGTNVTIDPDGRTINAVGGSGSVTDATGSAKGVVKLAGALGGTADAPTALGYANAAALSSALAAKQATLTGVADVPGLASALAGKQATLTAGANITINGTTISASGTGGSTPLVNDLTTGGTNAALTAEQGKTLKGLVDAKADAAATTSALAAKADASATTAALAGKADAAATTTALAGKADRARIDRAADITTGRAFAASDFGLGIRPLNNASVQAFTLPQASTMGLAGSGNILPVQILGALHTITAGSGVTINKVAGFAMAVGGTYILVQRGSTNVWDLS